MALSDIPGMPTWNQMATKIAHDYMDCLREASKADSEGNKREATSYRKMAAKFKKMMDKHQITIKA